MKQPRGYGTKLASANLTANTIDRNVFFKPKLVNYRFVGEVAAVQLRPPSENKYTAYGIQVLGPPSVTIIILPLIVL